MKTSWIKAFGMLAAGLFAVLVAPASAQVSTTATGPYYAVPSWDQKLTVNRFVVLSNWNNQAVLDRETGLVWEQSPDQAYYSWAAALDHCASRAVGGRMGWRLPGIQELASLIDAAVAFPNATLPAGHPFLVVQAFSYWSATTYASNTAQAYSVSFQPGFVSLNLKSGLTQNAWCVRGGQGPDVQ